MKKNSEDPKSKVIMFYENWGDLFLNLPDEQIVTLTKAMIQYVFKDKKDISFKNPLEKAMFEMIRLKLDSDKEHYEEICKKRAEYGKKGGESKNNDKNQDTTEESKSKQKVANDSKSEQVLPSVANKTKQNKTEQNKTNSFLLNKKEKEKEKEKTKKFIPPTLEEVTAYCKERQNNVDPQKFLDHYESVGWKKSTGTKVVNWQACVRTWENNSNNYNNKAPPKKTPEEIARDFFADIDDEDLWTIKKPKN